MRISDADRNAAMEALAEHLGAGRITLDEYGERTANVMVAKTADDVTAIFADLPAPHPVLSTAGQPVPPTKASATLPDRPGSSARELHPPAAHAVARTDQRSRAQKVVAVAASLSVFAALVLFFTTGSWLWFLLIPAISGVAQAIWGSDWNKPDRGSQHRQLD